MAALWLSLCPFLSLLVGTCKVGHCCTAWVKYKLPCLMRKTAAVWLFAVRPSSWEAASSYPGYWLCPADCWARLTCLAFELLPVPASLGFVLWSCLISRTDLSPSTSSLALWPLHHWLIRPSFRFALFLKPAAIPHGPQQSQILSSWFLFLLRSLRDTFGAHCSLWSLSHVGRDVSPSPVKVI